MNSKAELVFFSRRGLSRDEAARYIGVGTPKFDEMVETAVCHDQKDRRSVVWDRLKIEAFFSDLPDDETANQLGSDVAGGIDLRDVLLRRGNT